MSRELEPLTPASVPNLITGEVVDTSRAEDLVRYLEDLRDHERKIRGIRKDIEALVLEHAQQQGTKTLRFGKVEAKVSGGAELGWDIEVLQELTAAGLPEDRYAELVKETIEYKVNALVANQLERSGNPDYREIIERARYYTEKPFRVSTRVA